MKKVVLGLFLVAFTFVAQAQDKMMKTVKTIALEQTKGGKDASDAKNHIQEAYVSKMVELGKTETSKEVTLTKGTYKYFCPFNKTPQYTLVVE